MSPDLFNYYSELILKALGEERGLNVGGQNITNLQYADNLVLPAESADDLQRLLGYRQWEEGIINKVQEDRMYVFFFKHRSPKRPPENESSDHQTSFFFSITLVVLSQKTPDVAMRSREGLLRANSAFSKLESIFRNATLWRPGDMNKHAVYPVLM